MVKKAVIVAALALAFAPATARADWLFTPNVGAAFSGDVDTNVTFGASLAWMPGGFIGVEGDFSFTPDPFDNDFDIFDFDLGDTNVSTIMGNVIFGLPFGGTTGAGFRPYALGGIGWTRVDLGDDLADLNLFDDDTQRSFAMNFGAGAMGYFSSNIGVRGDIRWLRAFVDDDNIISPAFEDFRNFDFWRATGGVTFRW